MAHGIGYKESKTQFPAPAQYGDRFNKAVICECGDSRRREKTSLSALSGTAAPQHRNYNASTDEACGQARGVTDGPRTHVSVPWRTPFRSRSIPRGRPMFRSRSRATWGIFSIGGRRGWGGGILRGETEGRKQLCHCILFLFQLERARDRQRHNEATQRRCADRGGQFCGQPLLPGFSGGCRFVEQTSCSWLCLRAHSGQRLGHCMRSVCIGLAAWLARLTFSSAGCV